LPWPPPDRTGCALFIVNAKLDAVAVAEIELGEIAVKVLLATVLINAVHSALKDGEIALDGNCSPYFGVMGAAN